ncbi:DUF397 domain-containing protein [Streptomyces sp. NPDC050509]|uniref:DUF397 domain-containing protein n=1 Tax=Streptomyces sp. NPDC050509 TaxID=3365620 RepID=UPI00379CE5BB
MSDITWQISSHCQAGNSCIGVRRSGDTIHVRESEQPSETVITAPEKFRALILGVKAGTFDHLIHPARRAAPGAATPVGAAS